jgi:hypothetical protein
MYKVEFEVRGRTPRGTTLSVGRAYYAYYYDEPNLDVVRREIGGRLPTGYYIDFPIILWEDD